ncbi:MAG: virulence factor SrfB [Pseudomonadota bacterium]
MALNDALKSTQSISLIPFSGLQFLDFGFSIDAEGIPKEWGCYDATKRGERPEPGQFALISRGDEPIGKDTENLRASYSVERKRVLEMFLDQWVPLPLLRRNAHDFYLGPSNWARCRLVALDEPDEDGFDHRLVVAIDTNLMEYDDHHPYLAPSQGDAESGKIFGLGNQSRPITWFLSEEWVAKWIAELLTEMLERRQVASQRRRQPEPISQEDIEDELEGPAEHLLRFAAFVDLIDAAQVLPSKFKMVDTFTARRPTYIDCDLVLDIGNSRTCGLIVERDPDHGADVAQAVKLEIRDLTKPHYCYSDPFESRVEFAIPQFGKESLSARSGRIDAFGWPTMARVGKEAVRLSANRVGNEGNTGMSSPKRYLWNEDAPAQPWRLNTAGRDYDGEPFAAGSKFATLITDLGKPLHLAIQDQDDDTFPAMEARYSRSHLFSFALSEILVHALNMINSVAHRNRRPNSDNPRRLSRIIMTMPSALPLAERRIMQQRANAARDLVYLALNLARAATPAEREAARNIDAHKNLSPDGERVIDGVVWQGKNGLYQPEVVLQWDEASSTQVVYLYTQIVKNFAGRTPAFFDAMRSPFNTKKEALKVATIDIGGGTTDLVITEFTYEGTGNTVTITPNQLFREGFTTAGDDLVYRVIQKQVLSTIEKGFEAAGVISGRDLITQLFGSNRGDMDVAHQVRRQQFAIQVAIPIALGMLSAYEDVDPRDPNPMVEHRDFDDFFSEDTRPNEAVLDFVHKEARQMGADDFHLANLKFPIDMNAISTTVRSVFQPILDVLGEVIWRYRSDLLIVSGRPSRLPAISEMLSEVLPMMTGRIVALNQFRTGPWYPFRDFDSRIKDPKTTAAVGAMICSLAEGGMQLFYFSSKDLKAPKSTARYIGRLDGNGKISEDDIYYEDLDLDDETQEFPQNTFEFRGAMSIGFRQFRNGWWPATRLYTIDYKTDADRKRLNPRTPILVELKRAKLKSRGDKEEKRLQSETLEIASAMDEDGRNVRDGLALKLQTLPKNNVYWLDSGVLIEN